MALIKNLAKTMKKDNSRINPNGAPINADLIDRTRTLQSDISSRLRGLRESRSERLDTALQPGSQNIAEGEAQAGRRIARGPQGSRSISQASNLATDAELSRQELGVNELSNILNQEGGVQQLENVFTGMFNQFGAQAFQNELQGLGTEVNRYLAKEGEALDLQSLETQSARMASDMAGRFLTSIGMEVDRAPSDPIDPSPRFGQVTSQPSIFNQPTFRV